MKIITSVNLKEYVDNNPKDAEKDFPEFIRLLIKNTVAPITKFDLPTGNNVIQTGPDGVVLYHGTNKYLGDKEAIIEIGTNSDYKRKANDDIENRKSLANKDKNFIFITPRLWNDRNVSKDKWCREKKEEYGWNDVRIIDAAVLENWLEEDISTSKKILNKLGVNINFLFTIEEKEQQLIDKTKKGIDLNFFDYEDKKYDELISNLSKSYYHIIAPTREEGLYVTLFYLQKAQKDNTLIIEDMETWNELIQEKQISNCILIPNFYHDEELMVPEGNITIFIHDEDELSQESDYIIQQRTINNLKKELEKYYVINDNGKTKIDDQSIRNIIKESLGKYIPLKKHLFKDFIQPKWYRQDNKDLYLYLYLFFINSFKTDDLKIFEKFNLSVDELQQKLLTMSQEKDPFIIYYKYRNEYRVVNVYNAVQWLGNYITNQNLEFFCNIAEEVLSYIDPRYSKENIDNSYYIEGIEPKKYSRTLKNGVLKGLIITKLYLDNKNENALVAQITKMIKKYYSSIKTKEQFYNFASFAHKIVEIDYESFLNKIKKSISNDNFAMLFTEKKNNWFSQNEYCNIIFGIEKAVNKKEYIRLAIETLAELYTIKSDDTPNSPINTLKRIFLGWDNLTCLRYDEKILLLKNMIAHYRQLGKTLLKGILPNTGSTWTPLTKPEYDIYDEPQIIKYLREQIKYFNQYYLLYINNYVEKIEDILPLYHKCYFVEMDCYEAIKNKTIELLQDSTDEEKYSLKSIISEEIRGHKKFKNEAWNLTERELNFLTDLNEKIKYENDIYDYIYLYNYLPLLDKSELEIEKQEALEIIQLNPEQEAILIEKSDNKQQLIHDIYNKNHMKHYNINFVKHLLNFDIKNNSHIINFYIKEIYKNEALENIINIYNTLCQSYELDKVITILTCCGYNEKLYSQIKGTSSEALYWKHMTLNNGTDEMFVYQKCFEYKNYKMCLEIIYEKLDRYEEKCELLEKIKEEKYEITGSEKYLINRIFKYFHNYTKVDNFKKLANLEIYYAPILEDKAYFLSKEAQKSPDIVTELIEMFTTDDDGNEIELENKEVIVSNCYQKFSQLKIHFEDMNSAEWCSQFLKILENKNRKKYSRYYLGRLLGRTPIDTKNDIFPSKSIQKIIEKYYSDELKQGFITEVYNSRGVHTVDKGEEENELYEQYLYWYQKIQVSSPNTAKILKNLSQIYKNESIKMREEANYV